MSKQLGWLSGYFTCPGVILFTFTEVNHLACLGAILFSYIELEIGGWPGSFCTWALPHMGTPENWAILIEKCTEGTVQARPPLLDWGGGHNHRRQWKCKHGDMGWTKLKVSLTVHYWTIKVIANMHTFTLFNTWTMIDDMWIPLWLQQKL